MGFGVLTTAPRSLSTDVFPLVDRKAAKVDIRFSEAIIDEQVKGKGR